MEQPGSHWTDFHATWYLRIFRKFIEITKNNKYFTWRPSYFHDNMSLNSSQNEKCFRHKLQKNQNTHFMFSNPFSENRAVYEVMWRNMVSREGHRYENIIRRRKGAIRKADNERYRHAFRIFNSYCFSMATVVTRTRLNVTLYVRCLSCMFNF
jgi:hypothetical protein